MTLLDTDTLSLLMHGHDRVTRRVEQSDAITITIVTRIEILRGRFDYILKAANGAEVLKAQHWLIENENYLEEIDVAAFDDRAAAEFDKLRRNTKIKKIGRADLLIASIALAHRATLITRNVKDFRLVPGLAFENWAD
jgi:tRNA(fMet)-specific endonuclease VapC